MTPTPIHHGSSINEKKTASFVSDPFPLYCGLTVAYGLVNGLTSPALPDLAEQAHLDSSGLGALFLPRGAGSMLGAFIIGAVLDLVRNPHAVLAGCLLLRLVACLFMPYVDSLYLAGVDFFFVAFGGNAIYLCGATSISWTYGKLMGARVSLMDASFGVGGAFSPILASFLVGSGLRSVNGYQFIAMFDLLFLVATVVLKAKPNPKFVITEPVLQQGLLESSKADRDESAPIKWFAVVLCGLIILFTDITISANLFWFYYYTTQDLDIPPPWARGLNTAFWICFTGVQFVWAYLQSPQGYSIKAETILKCLMPFSFVVSCGIALPVGHGELGGLLPAFAMVSLGLAGGMNALTTTLLRQRSMISGKVGAVLRIASACGNMCGGASVGFLHNFLGRYALPAVAAGSTLLNILFLGVLHVIGS